MHNVKVQDENQLLKWLIDPYKSFILSKTVLQSKRKQTPKQYENHHIFPKHLGGLDTHWKHKPTGIELVILPLRNGSTIANLAHELQKAVVTEYIKPTTIKHLATVIKHQKIGSTRNNWIFLGTIIRSQDL